MNRFRKMILIVIAVLVCTYAFCACAETVPEGAEQGLEEIRPLMELADVQGTEGMSLEEMTDAFENASMCEYLDSVSGFRMQYPAVFLFDDEKKDLLTAVTEDGRAAMTIENMYHDGGLTMEILLEAIRLEVPDFDVEGSETNGCLRLSRSAEQGKMIQTDLYYLTGKSLHHIILCYPSEEKETYASYIDYMINTMETSESDLG